MWRQKRFNVKLSTTAKREDIKVFFFVTVGGEIDIEVWSATVTRQKPAIFSYTGDASSESTKIALKKYGLGDDFKRKIGNDKIEACVFVYNLKNGRLMEEENTNGYFKDTILKLYKKEMDEIAKEDSLKLKESGALSNK